MNENILETELTMEQHLRLMELESKNLEFLYKSYPDFSSSPRQHYIGVAHSEQRRMLDEFYKKWKVKRP